MLLGAHGETGMQCFHLQGLVTCFYAECVVEISECGDTAPQIQSLYERNVFLPILNQNLKKECEEVYFCNGVLFLSICTKHSEQSVVNL